MKRHVPADLKVISATFPVSVFTAHGSRMCLAVVQDPPLTANIKCCETECINLFTQDVKGFSESPVTRVFRTSVRKGVKGR